MIFGDAYSTLRREGTVVIGGNILVGDEGRDELKKVVRSVEVSLSKSR